MAKSESTSNFESKKIIQFWGVYCCPPLLQSCPLILISVDPNPRDQAPISWSVFFQKSSLMFVVLHWTINSPEESALRLNNGNVLTKKPTNAVFAQLGLFFWQNCWGAAVFETSSTFSPGTLLSNTTLQSYVSFFEKTVRQVGIQGRFYGPFRAKSIKMVHFRGQICKIGGKILLPKFFSVFNRLFRIQRRLWFCYQICLNLIMWLSYG